MPPLRTETPGTVVIDDACVGWQSRRVAQREFEAFTNVPDPGLALKVKGSRIQ